MSESQTPVVSLTDLYQSIRGQSLRLCENLKIEDFVIQGCADVSPPKWHLAHVTWFFDNFVLKKFENSYEAFDSRLDLLFNSYYKSQGPHWIQGERGRLSRPTVDEVVSYRKWADEKMLGLFSKHSDDPSFQKLVVLGLNHEQQHQELLLMDTLYNFAINPLGPSYQDERTGGNQPAPSPIKFRTIDKGNFTIARDYSSNPLEFCFDNETPEHEVHVCGFRIADRLTTNSEYLAFIEDSGYERPEFWLSDGWNWIQKTGANAPLYWKKEGKRWQRMTLYGWIDFDPNEPVSHVSYFEADAFARWSKKRLPREAEWEIAAQTLDQEFSEASQFVEDRVWTPQNRKSFHGSLWQWTSTPYSQHPRFKEPKGALGEYNAKFMCNQLVLKGGCLATPKSHYRNTYRNFFYPEKQWPFTGIRLAEDLD